MAVALIAVGITISMIDQFSPGARPQSVEHTIIGIIWPLLRFGVACWVCVQIARGRSWARWLLLAATVFIVMLVMAGIAMVPKGVVIGFDRRLLVIAIELLPIALYIAALCLVFGPGRAWFRRPVAGR